MNQRMILPLSQAWERGLGGEGMGLAYVPNACSPRTSVTSQNLRALRASVVPFPGGEG